MCNTTQETYDVKLHHHHHHHHQDKLHIPFTSGQQTCSTWRLQSVAGHGSKQAQRRRCTTGSHITRRYHCCNTLVASSIVIMRVLCIHTQNSRSNFNATWPPCRIPLRITCSHTNRMVSLRNPSVPHHAELQTSICTATSSLSRRALVPRCLGTSCCTRPGTGCQDATCAVHA